MANTEVITEIVTVFGQVLPYMAPIIGLLAGLNWVFTFLIRVTMGASRDLKG